MRARVIAALLMAAGAAFGGDAAFDRVVKAIETHYGTKRTHIPLMGVANFFVKVRHPEGVAGFKLAVFEDLRSPAGIAERRELDRFMDTLSAGGLRPVVRVHSRRGEESTYIYARPAGKSATMLIATFERQEATVVQATVNVKILLKSLEDPERAQDALGVQRDRERE
jgi:hypothetical protein